MKLTTGRNKHVAKLVELEELRRLQQDFPSGGP